MSKYKCKLENIIKRQRRAKLQLWGSQVAFQRIWVSGLQLEQRWHEKESEWVGGVDWWWKVVSNYMWYANNLLEYNKLLENKLVALLLFYYSIYNKCVTNCSIILEIIEFNNIHYS